MSTSSRTFSFGQLEACAEIGWLGDLASYSVIIRLGNCSTLASCEIAQGTGHQALQASFSKRSYAQGVMASLTRREDQPSATELAHADFLQSIFQPVLRSAPSTCVNLHIQVLEEDARVDIRLAAALAASLCLSLTGLVQGSPKALVQLAVIDGQCQINPSQDLIKSAQANLWAFGDAEHLLYVDGSARELDEKLLIKALEAAHGCIKETTEALADISSLGKPQENTSSDTGMPLSALHHRVSALAVQPLLEILAIANAEERNSRWRDLHRAVQLSFCLNNDNPDYLARITYCFRQITTEVVRARILNGAPRLDLRGAEQIRPRSKIEVGSHNRAHGSACVAMPGSIVHTTSMVGLNRSVLDKFPGASTEVFAAHVYLHAKDSSGIAAAEETSRWLTHTLRPVIPPTAQFPYTLRVDCEYWGHTSTSRQDALCAATLALMDAGVPIKAPVAAVEIGLICSPTHCRTLSELDDIERPACDLVAILAGSQAGLTGIHLRNRAVSLTPEILTGVLHQARQNRLELLLRMSDALAAPRTLNPQIPRVKILRISPNQTGLLVGRGGTTVRALCEETSSQIEVFPDGRVLVSATNDLCLQQAIAAIEMTLKPIRIGQIYQGTVSGFTEHGVLITLAPGRSGLLPMSATLSPDSRPDKQFRVGESVRTLCTELDKRGRIWLSIKALYEQEDLNDRSDSGPVRLA